LLSRNITNMTNQMRLHPRISDVVTMI
jgi:hypothetical protein